MNAFWTFSRQMFRKRATVAWALFFAVISAGGLGVGLLSLGPALKLILDGETLPTLAAQFNANGHMLTIPQGLIDWLPNDGFMGVVTIIGAIIFLTIFGGTANFMHMYLSQSLAARTVARIRQQVFRHVVHLPLATVITRGPSEFVARIVRDAAELQRGFIALTSKSVTHVLKGLAAMVVAFYVHWQFTLTAIVLAPILAIVMRKLGKRVRRSSRGSLAAQEGLLRVANEALHGLRAVKANTGEREAGRRFHRINKIVVREELKLRTARALTGPLTETIAIIAIGCVAILAAKAIIQGHLPFDRFVLSLGALGIAFASLRPVTGLVNEIHAAAAPAERLAEMMNEPPETVSRVARRLPRHQVAIEFDNIGYTYAGADRPALEHVTLRVAHGERLAIVGPNGSGKTTLVSLLARLFEPTYGRILIDGIDIATANLMALRRQIGVVTQETVLFRGSIADNIAFGSDGHSRQEIIEAARRARADEFICELPSGYDADVAEQGASLSGGQRQRLAIARAILRDPAILILDEATSQIDNESETQITAALAEFCRGRTALLIAHRLQTVLNADRIVVMDRGRIVAQGKNEALMQSCELYRRLAETQLVGAE